MYRSILTAAFGVFVLSSALVAQPQWTALSPSGNPTGRSETASAASPTNVYMFGGKTGASTWTDELWQFGISWSKQVPATGTATPPARRGASAAYDTKRSRFVVFGGFAELIVQSLWVNSFGDTWEWTGTQWELKTVVAAPSPRGWASMVYDVDRSRAMLFGGAQGLAHYNDTWVWNGTIWSKLPIATPPPVRRAAAMAYNSESGETLLFGGEQGINNVNPPTILSDTWRYDGSSWRQLTTLTTPGGVGLTKAKMIYDAARDRYVLYGGQTGPSAYNRDVWEFDGIDWQKRVLANPQPVGRHSPVFEYMGLQRRTLMFSGEIGAPTMPNDNWQYQTSAIADFIEFGTGCASSAGIPVQHALEKPWLGGNLALEIQKIPANALTYLVTGWKTANFQFMPNTRPECVLLADPLFISLLAPSQASGLPTLNVPIPNMTSLLGLTLYTQAGVVESGSGSTGGISARGYVIFGAR